MSLNGWYLEILHCFQTGTALVYFYILRLSHYVNLVELILELMISWHFSNSLFRTIIQEITMMSVFELRMRRYIAMVQFQNVQSFENFATSAIVIRSRSGRKLFIFRLCFRHFLHGN